MNYLDKHIDEMECNQYIEINNKTYPIKSVFCRGCGGAWGSKLYDKPPKNITSFPMEKDGKTVYAVPRKFAWYKNYAYHRECLEKKFTLLKRFLLRRKSFNTLVKLGEISTE